MSVGKVKNAANSAGDVPRKNVVFRCKRTFRCPNIRLMDQQTEAPTDEPTDGPTNPPACLPTCVPVCLRACLPACLATYLYIGIQYKVFKGIKISMNVCFKQ